jgi:thioredoxin
MLELNKNNFKKEVLDSDIPVIVDFWASWCGPCMMMAPVFEKVSKDFEGKMKFAKVSTEQEQELAQQYSIRSIPVLKIFNKGEEVDELIGFKPEEQLKAEIDNYLKKL